MSGIIMSQGSLSELYSSSYNISIAILPPDSIDGVCLVQIRPSEAFIPFNLPKSLISVIPMSNS
ncbi:hypothetical protein Sjap_025816 [Stephania japonica]|uniref:Uncharacterized protein n=1 Tax=Stephania japonica TaxID=461633 RepID=A0AAP0E2B7_9MAGN